MNAEDALRDYAIEAEKDGEELAVPSPSQTIETPKGTQLTSIPLIRPSGTGVHPRSRVEAQGRILRDARIELFCVNLSESATFVGGKVFEKPAAHAAHAAVKAK